MTESLLQPIRDMVIRRHFAGLADSELLRRFAHSRDEDAFSELVWRHSTVVWRVCQSVLPRPDAEDAFQAAFVVLARKAGSLRGDSLASWLFRVAYRISLRAWKNRRRHAPVALPINLPAPDDGLVGWRELQGVLQAEVSRLPEKYRETLLLCAFDGCSKTEAAGRLGIPEGTISSRLAAAREMLRRRLTRRGIELPLVFAGPALGAPLATATLRRSAEIALGSGAVPAGVARMLEQAFAPLVGAKTFFLSAVAVALFIGGPLLLGGLRTPPAEDPKQPPVELPQPRAENAPSALLEQDGDPLPPEALARFGTPRFRKAEAFRVTELSQDGKLLASMGSSGVFVWELQTGRVVRQFPPMWAVADDKGSLCFVDEDRRLVVASRSRSTGSFITVRPNVERAELATVWDIESGKLVRKLLLQNDGSHRWTEGVWPIEDGKKFVSISIDWPDRKQPRQTRMTVWDAKTLAELERHTTSVVITNALDYSPARDCFLCCRSSDATWIPRDLERGELAILLDRKSGKEVWASGWEEWAGAKFGFSPDGSRLAISREKKLQVLTVATGKIETLKASPPRRGSHPTFLPDGQSLLYTENQALNQIEPSADAAPRKRATVPTGFYFHILPDGEKIVGADDNDLLREFDVATGKETPRPTGYRKATKAVCQRRGSLVALTDPFGKLDLWDAATGKLVRSLRPGRPSYGRPAYDLAFSPDDKILASATTAGVIDLWSVADGKLLHSVPAGKDERDKVDGADYVQFSNDGKRLYFLPQDRPTACLDVETGKRVDPGPLWNQYGRIVPNSDHVLMPNGIFDLPSGQLVRKFDFSFGPPQQLFRGNLSADGRRLAGTSVGEWGYHIYVQDLVAGKGLMSSWPPLGGGGLTVARLHPDGKWLTAMVGDGALRVWEVATGEQVYQIDGLNSPYCQRMELGPRGRSVLPSNDLAPILYSLRPLDTPKKFDPDLWDQLGDKPPAAYRAQWAMLDHPEKAVALLKEKLPPEAAKRGRDWFDGLVGKLASPVLQTREASFKTLQEAVTEIPAEWVQEAVSRAGSDEVRNRLVKIQGHCLRTDRAVQVAEMIDTPAARQLLKAWSEGTGISNLKDAAAQALQRLGSE
jgi:RNA polymerase sigma factor (sigma-70 family)